MVMAVLVMAMVFGGRDRVGAKGTGGSASDVHVQLHGVIRSLVVCRHGWRLARLHCDRCTTATRVCEKTTAKASARTAQAATASRRTEWLIHGRALGRGTREGFVPRQNNALWNPGDAAGGNGRRPTQPRNNSTRREVSLVVQPPTQPQRAIVRKAKTLLPAAASEAICLYVVAYPSAKPRPSCPVVVRTRG